MVLAKSEIALKARSSGLKALKILMILYEFVANFPKQRRATTHGSTDMKYFEKT